MHVGCNHQEAVTGVEADRGKTGIVEEVAEPDTEVG